MNKYPTGTKVCDKWNSCTQGTICSEPVNVEGPGENQTDYVIKLEKGFFSENRDVYISHLLIHESNIEVLENFRYKI